MPRYAMLRYAVLCCAVLCYAMLQIYHQQAADRQAPVHASHKSVQICPQHSHNVALQFLVVAQTMKKS